MGDGDIASPFLISVLDGGEWSVSRTGRFTPGEREHATHWIGGWVGSRDGVDACGVRKISCLYQKSNPIRQARSLSLYRLSCLGSYVPAPHKNKTEALLSEPVCSVIR
jgi:hypothetical protein